MKRTSNKTNSKSSKRPKKSQITRDDSEEEAEEDEKDLAATMKKMQVEVDGLRRLCQESRAIAETWGDSTDCTTRYNE